MACLLIINTLPQASLEGKVVEYVWIGIPINLHNLRIFRCLAYVHISNKDQTKLDPKSNKCVFIGYIKRFERIQVVGFD